MNAQLMAKTAYSIPGLPTRTPRRIEYDLFARITHRLKSAHDRDRGASPDLVAALHDNRQLWTTLAADVADPENGLPETLRARIFYLAQFTSQHTSKVLSGNTNAEVLIDINTSIMRGLRTEGQIG